MIEKSLAAIWNILLLKISQHILVSSFNFTTKFVTGCFPGWETEQSVTGSCASLDLVYALYSFHNFLKALNFSKHLLCEGDLIRQ